MHSEMDVAFLRSLLEFAHQAIAAFSSANALLARLEPTVGGSDAEQIRAISVAMRQAVPPLFALHMQISVALGLSVDEAAAVDGRVN
jgi:hypothetical protein